MKHLLLIVALAGALLSGAGCASIGSGSSTRPIQAVLDAILPPSFTGDIDTHYTIPAYLDVQIAAGGLFRGSDGIWHFTWAEYRRNGPAFSTASIRIGKRP